MKNFLFFFTPIIVACNIYSPFTTISSDEDRKERAMKCLHDDDYNCAIEQYNNTSDDEVKRLRLCMIYVSKGGMGLKTFIDIFSSKESIDTALGRLGQTIAKNTSSREEMLDKVEAFKKGKAECDNYAKLNNDDFAKLFKALSRFGHCAALMAKADFCACSSDGQTEVTDASGMKDGLTKGDIYDGTGGAIESRGMCSSDATALVVSLGEISGDIGGFGNMLDILNQLPDELKNSGAANNIIREEIGKLIP